MKKSLCAPQCGPCLYDAPHGARAVLGDALCSGSVALGCSGTGGCPDTTRTGLGRSNDTAATQKRDSPPIHSTNRAHLVYFQSHWLLLLLDVAAKWVTVGDFLVAPL